MSRSSWTAFAFDSVCSVCRWLVDCVFSCVRMCVRCSRLEPIRVIQNCAFTSLALVSNKAVCVLYMRWKNNCETQNAHAYAQNSCQLARTHSDVDPRRAQHSPRARESTVKRAMQGGRKALIQRQQLVLAQPPLISERLEQQQQQTRSAQQQAGKQQLAWKQR